MTHHRSFVFALGSALLLMIGVSTGDSKKPPPKADRDMQEVLDAMDKLGGKPIETLTPEEARKQPTPADAVKAVQTKRGGKPTLEPVAKTEDRTYGDAKIPMRIYTPKGKGPFPVIVYYHGGGFVIGSIDSYDATPRALANATGAIVVSADYRLAPEHKFPTQHDDAFTAYRWVVDNAASFGGDPNRIAIAGESAGGNLAINTAIRARDEKAAMPVHMLLVYPAVGTDQNTPSYIANENAKPLNKAMTVWFVKQGLSDPAKEAKDPRIDVVSRKDLAGLPSATVITAEIDPLRSEGQMLAKNLAAQGVKVDAADYTGVTHEFFVMPSVVADAKVAHQRAAKNLKAAFRSPEKPTKVGAR